MRRSNEPIAWSLFGAGGMVLAFVGPAMLVITGLLLPLIFAQDPGRAYAAVSGTLSGPLAKLFMLLFVSLSLYHTAHRLYHGLHDLHVEGPRALLLSVFYGGATLLTLLTGFLLYRI